MPHSDLKFSTRLRTSSLCRAFHVTPLQTTTPHQHCAQTLFDDSPVYPAVNSLTLSIPESNSSPLHRSTVLMDVDAAMAPVSAQSLMSSQSKSSLLQVVVHPLVLFGVSDHVSRHFIRQQEGPVVGAILGQQNGREITMEHTFECQLKKSSEAVGGYLLDIGRFKSRLDQMTTVHMDRELGLVGWYTIVTGSGPLPVHVPINRQFLETFNDSALMLLFHGSDAGIGASAGKIPATVYETIHEAEDREKGVTDGCDTRMWEPTLQARFRQVPFNIETEETELISMNYVAEGSGNASSATAATGNREDRPFPSIESTDRGSTGKGKGKRTLLEAESDEINIQSIDQGTADLTREEDEMIAALTTKANAVKMLHSRIRLLTTYLQHLPPSYINGHTMSSTIDTIGADQTTPSHCILRQILALVNRLDLIVPTHKQEFEAELEREANNVSLTNLMSALVQSLNDARQVGKKLSAIEREKAAMRAEALNSDTLPPLYNAPGMSGAGAAGVFN
ncbi:related to cop9 (constitutive photomorphogenic),subunit 6 [Claviceps purpurea 20.1]|uniref:COP9 signalosome complex subunit 6 n=1 Tax=Claviceps purpurea (strain 20.1) TaxID=1111077 RepID=M1W616_CLAP2|nr:hypothetical protein E4U28_004865 [Claviceps purpurea]KAG6285552.1 hypothetical protein E4U46_005690 [Claviceps purpurea]CCE30260.1 related to cop9 (constitutive photomorphogenic),subunit 6 [Claviceps purpurea 20.1]